MRGAPGRGGVGRGMLPGEGRCPMPCDDENGLLPGRGVRWPMPWFDEYGLLPGRGALGRGMPPPPGRGAELGLTASGVAGAPAAGVLEAAFSAAFSAAAFSAAA